MFYSTQISDTKVKMMKLRLDVRQETLSRLIVAIKLRFAS